MNTWMRKLCFVIVLNCFAHLSPAPLAGTDELTLRALHEKAMRAHRQSNADLLLEDDAENYVLVNRGEVSRPTLAQRRARLSSYLQSTTFEEYRDVTEPIVTVSKDGTLGWVVVQIHARGVQRTMPGKEEPLDFTSAWIELYEKRGGRWYSVGNVSNFKP